MKDAVGAKEVRAVSAAHEAGMHDSKPRPETCKLCKKEIDMAKEATVCAACGGSYDGTPSGLTKHQKTSKHMNAVAQSAKDVSAPREVQPVTEADQVQRDMEADEGAFRDDGTHIATPALVVEGTVLGPLATALDKILRNRTEEEARRQQDHQWRVKNKTAAEADAYWQDKIIPLRFEIDTLRQAIAELSK